MQVEAATGHRFWRALLQVLVGEGMVGCALWGVHGLSWKGCGETANISVRLVASAVLTPTTVRTWCDTLCEALPDAARESLETARFVDPERLVYIMYALSSSSMPRL